MLFFILNFSWEGKRKLLMFYDLLFPINLKFLDPKKKSPQTPWHLAKIFSVLLFVVKTNRVLERRYLVDLISHLSLKLMLIEILLERLELTFLEDLLFVLLMKKRLKTFCWNLKKLWFFPPFREETVGNWPVPRNEHTFSFLVLFSERSL